MLCGDGEGYCLLVACGVSPELMENFSVLCEGDVSSGAGVSAAPECGECVARLERARIFLNGETEWDFKGSARGGSVRNDDVSAGADGVAVGILRGEDGTVGAGGERDVERCFSGGVGREGLCDYAVFFLPLCCIIEGSGVERGV